MEKLYSLLNSMMEPAGAGKADGGARIDEEDMRLVSGFADIFSAVMLAGAFITLMGLVGVSTSSFAVAGLVAAAAAWFLTPAFVEQRHFAASGVVLSIVFALGVSAVLAPFIPALSLLPAAVATWFYWRRYRVPISAAVALICLVITPIMVVVQLIDLSKFMSVSSLVGILSTLAGLSLFGLAMYWDLSDRDRKTRRSDVAFWLHLAAGPMIVHGIFSVLGIGSAGLFGFGLLAGLGITGSGLGSAIPVIVIFALFTIVALLIDRRPLLLSSLGYLIFAIGSIARSYWGDGSHRDYTNGTLTTMAITGMTIGLLVVVLAGGWSSIRAALLKMLPESTRDRLPPVSHWTPPAEQADRPLGENEPLRLVLGLNDWFASIGLGALFFGGVFAGLSTIQQIYASIANDQGPGAFGQNPKAFESIQIYAWLPILVPMVLIWLASEFFVRRRRMALTAYTAANTIGLLSIAGVGVYIMTVAISPMKESGTQQISFFHAVFPWLVAAGVNWAFWIMNRVPASFAWGCAMLFPIFCVDLMTTRSGHDPAISVQLRALIFGFLAFAVAMWWDRSDPTRKTQRADTGFWMHLLAAFFIVPSLFGYVSQTVPILGLLLSFFLIITALVIDRRAMLLVAVPFALINPGAYLGFDPGLVGRLLLFVLMIVISMHWDRLREMLGIVSQDGRDYKSASPDQH